MSNYSRYRDEKFSSFTEIPQKFNENIFNDYLESFYLNKLNNEMNNYLLKSII